MSENQHFRVGQGYVEFWVHETTHWNVSESERIAIQELHESFLRLIQQRNAVQDARRAFMPASSLSTHGSPTTANQNKLFNSTHDFFQTYYSTLSAFASMLVRFRDELGNVPHRSNSKFIDWLEPLALWREASIPMLQEARQFRALIDHRASHKPFRWGTTVGADGLTRVFLHGAGATPPGAMSRLDGDLLREDDTWSFVAPDEELVLTMLAIQMNALFPRLQSSRIDLQRAKTCSWNLLLSEDEPEGGYPIFAHADGGVVTEPGENGIVISEEDQKAIDDILARYLQAGTGEAIP